MLNKVPKITLYFWIIKILCTTVGETAANFLNTKLNLGLTGTTVVMGQLLLVAFFSNEDPQNIYQLTIGSLLYSLVWSVP